MGAILFVHGMGIHKKHYWREYAANLLPELSALGFPVKLDNCGGIYYDDLVPHPIGGMDEEMIRQYKEQLRSEAIAELGKYRGIFSKSTAAVHNLANVIVETFGDIFTYLYLDKTFQAVNERVYDGLAASKKPVTLIGYSLGSLVGYCALNKSPEAASAVEHLVMVGSPLFWFRRGVAARADFKKRPAVRRFTNVAGIFDIAWPRAVPELLTGLDDNISFVIDRFNPIKGHRKYFSQRQALSLVATAIARGWGYDSSTAKAKSSLEFSEIISSILSGVKDMFTDYLDRNRRF